MKPYFQDNLEAIYCGDCRSMVELPDESVQCIVTSPPYWGLRRYEGSQELIWGGDKNCQHQWVNREYLMHSGRGDAQKSGKYSTQEPISDMPMLDNICSLCGAWKGAFGLEPTPELYVQHTIEILREIRRILRKDGVVFWNIGDSYASGDLSRIQRGQCDGPKKHLVANSRIKLSGVKPKDLCLIPFRIALAAQSDGWWIRSAIIWNKPNPMPESVTDRPTNSYEFILMLTKSKKYYWDADAVREPQAEGTFERYGKNPNIPTKKKWLGVEGESHVAIQEHIEKQGKPMQAILPQGRNLRDVWTFPTTPYPEAHFAVFPEKLPELCIKAATSEKGCCPKCGAPWARVVDKRPSQFNIRVRDARAGRATAEEGYKATEEEIAQYPGNHPDMGYRQTVGWRPTCNCGDLEPVPCTVLDNFMGTGTTLWVAKKLGRRAIGYDISEAYCQLAVERNRQMALEIK